MYHVMSRGVNRCLTFHDDHDRHTFLSDLGELVQDGALIIHAFCLMLNHFHMLCETPVSQLGRWMQQILSHYSQYFNKRHGRIGHLWQARYKAILVEEGDYFLECSRYIHLNPNRSKISRPAELYYWSSYRNFVGGPSAVDWVNTERTLRHFGGPEEYRQFVERGEAERPISPFERAAAGYILGSKAFLERIRLLAECKKESANLPSLRNLRRIRASLPPDQIRAAVERIFASYSTTRRSQLFAYALRRHTWLTGKEVATVTGKSQAAVSEVLKEVDKRAAVDSLLAENLKKLMEDLNQYSASNLIDSNACGCL
jgi:REP element-mobilizing transposase RayT